MVKRPDNVFNYIKRKFSWEGFTELNVVDALVEIGYSGAEAKRLFNAGGIKIWDTKVKDGMMVWYKRRANLIEVIEPDDTLVIGKPKVLIIKQIPFSIFEKIYYNLRLWFEIGMDKWSDLREARWII